MVRGALVGEGDDDGGGGKGTWSYAAVRADMNEPRNAAIRRAIFGVLTLFGVINMIILLSMTLEQVDSASYAVTAEFRTAKRSAYDHPGAADEPGYDDEAYGYNDEVEEGSV